MFHKHIFIDHICKHLSIIYVHSSDIFFIWLDLTQKEPRYNENDKDEKDNEHLDLVINILQESW